MTRKELVEKMQSAYWYAKTDRSASSVDYDPMCASLKVVLDAIESGEVLELEVRDDEENKNYKHVVVLRKEYQWKP